MRTSVVVGDRRRDFQKAEMSFFSRCWSAGDEIPRAFKLLWTVERAILTKSSARLVQRYLGLVVEDGYGAYEEIWTEIGELL